LSLGRKEVKFRKKGGGGQLPDGAAETRDRGKGKKREKRPREYLPTSVMREKEEQRAGATPKGTQP